MRPGLWTQVTPSAYVHEREALDFLRRHIPDREPFRVWANFTFVDRQGRLNEVDCFVVTPTACFLVEIKSHPGRIDGDFGQWTWITPEGRRRSMDNPLPAAETKAKALKDLLARQPAVRAAEARRQLPFFRSAVFLSAEQLTCTLAGPAREGIFQRDLPEDERVPDHRLPGVVATLTAVDPRARTRVDRPTSHTIAQAMGEAGIRESIATRRIAGYELTQLIEDGDTWQDYVAENIAMRDEVRRIRLFPAGEAVTSEEREDLVRSAEREYRLLRDVEHPGVARPLAFHEHERGPALVYPYQAEARRLDLWLADEGQRLDLSDRLDLVRQLGEALRAAHRLGLYHRGLAPRHCSVLTVHDRASLVIRDWPTAARRLATSLGGTTGPSRLAERTSGDALLYLAPEIAAGVMQAEALPADIYGLGAVAVFLLTGQAPAPDLDSLHAALDEHGSLSLALLADGIPSDLEFLVEVATQVDPSDRPLNVDEFLGYLDGAFQELTKPAEADPLDAAKGDQLTGGYVVDRRLGSGSTGVVLLTRRDGREEVLKIARDRDAEDRLRVEDDVLRGLRHPGVIQSYGLDEIGGRLVLRLEPAATTLSRRIQEDGPAGLELLQRFGGDLLDVLVHLDQEGIAHRDVKPDNLGLVRRGRNHELHLVLFDFSLSRVDPADLRAGTSAYLDPFLSARPTRRWDAQAERYAAAVTLHELATGRRPVWGDGETDPQYLDDEVARIATEVLDPTVRTRLGAFFGRALQRDPARRFDTAAQMRREWERAFEGLAADGDAVVGGVPAEEVDLTAATLDTVVVDLGLAGRVVAALERIGVTTLGDLQGIPGADLRRLPGVGAATRKEISHLTRRLAELLPPSDVPTSDDSHISIDRLAELLLPRASGDDATRGVLTAVLGLDVVDRGPWPSTRAVAEALDVPREGVAEALAAGRQRWRRRPEVTALRNDLVELLRGRAGVAGVDELGAALLASRGSLSGRAERVRRAGAAVRAAVEVEAALDSPRMVARRLGERTLLLLDGPAGGDEGEVHDADLVREAAALLGEMADEIAVARPLAPPEQVLARLRDVVLPAGAPALPDARLVRVAAAASAGSAVSSRLEIYPVRMLAARALEEAGAALLDRGGLERCQLRQRVRARFPESEPLPESNAALDELVLGAGLGLVLSGSRYRLQGLGSLVTSATTGWTSTSYASPGAREEALGDLEARLDRLSAQGGFCVLTADAGRLSAVAHAVRRHLGAAHLDLDALLVAAMRAEAERAKADWQRILVADAAPDGPHLAVRTLAGRAEPILRERLLAVEGALVVTGLGLLARYDRLGLIEGLRDLLTRSASEQPLRSLVVVVPGVDPAAPPTIDRHPIPVVTANQWAHVPSAWLAMTA